MRTMFLERIGEDGTAEVEYGVTEGERYGIRGSFRLGGEESSIKSPKLFLTKEEAIAWCKFMAENKVLPSSLNQVLSDEFYIHKNSQTYNKKE